MCGTGESAWKSWKSSTAASHSNRESIPTCEGAWKVGKVQMHAACHSNRESSGKNLRIPGSVESQ